MWNKIKNSRKARAAMLTIFVAIAAAAAEAMGIGVDKEMITRVLQGLMVYILGQGIADAGNGGSQ